MYSYPLLLLTNDDVRNATIADLLELEFTDYANSRRELYSRLSDETVRHLYDLLDINTTVNKMLYIIFRSNVNAVKKDTTPLDTWRIKERLKRSLFKIRTCCGNILHSYDNYAFSDSLMKLDLWENYVNIVDTTFNDWNNNFLQRIGDIHKHIYRLVSVLETLLLLSSVSLKPVTVVKKEDYTNTIKSLGKILEACRTIHTEVADYFRLVDSL